MVQCAIFPDDSRLVNAFPPSWSRLTTENQLKYGEYLSTLWLQNEGSSKLVLLVNYLIWLYNLLFLLFSPFQRIMLPFFRPDIMDFPIIRTDYIQPQVMKSFQPTTIRSRWNYYEWQMKVGQGHLRKDLKLGRKARRKIGGSVMVSVGWISSSITGAIFRMKLSKRWSASRLYILLTSME